MRLLCSFVVVVLLRKMNFGPIAGFSEGIVTETRCPSVIHPNGENSPLVFTSPTHHGHFADTRFIGEDAAQLPSQQLRQLPFRMKILLFFKCAISCWMLVIGTQTQNWRRPPNSIVIGVVGLYIKSVQETDKWDGIIQWTVDGWSIRLASSIRIY